MTQPEPSDSTVLQLYRLVAALVALLGVLAMQATFAMLLSQVLGVWAWILFYIFGSVFAILALITVLELIESVIIAVQSRNSRLKFDRAFEDWYSKQKAIK